MGNVRSSKFHLSCPTKLLFSFQCLGISPFPNDHDSLNDSTLNQHRRSFVYIAKSLKYTHPEDHCSSWLVRALRAVAQEVAEAAALEAEVEVVEDLEVVAAALLLLPKPPPLQITRLLLPLMSR